MHDWAHPADPATIDRVIAALKSNGIDAILVENGQQAKEKVFAMLPAGDEVFAMSSETLKTIGVTREIDESGKYTSVRKQLIALNRETQRDLMRKIGSAPQWCVGSVHAVTETGQLLIASNTGSQLPAYAYSAGQVIWVVGAQKIVKDLDAGLERIYEYVFPLEDARMKRDHGVGSGVNKLLIINKEKNPKRCTVIFVKEVLGF